jgi:outer membrane lipoprotein SlyB
MKALINDFRSTPLVHRLIVVAEIVAIVVVFAFSPGKAHAQSGNVYAAPQVQTAGDALPAVVLQVAIKQAEPSFEARAAGASVGTALGLLAASHSGYNSRWVANTAGATLGALVGERTASLAMRDPAQEIIVQLRDGRLITVVQPAPFDQLMAGQLVYVIAIRGVYRVVPQLLPRPLL